VLFFAFHAIFLSVKLCPHCLALHWLCQCIRWVEL